MLLVSLNKDLLDRSEQRSAMMPMFLLFCLYSTNTVHENKETEQTMKHENHFAECVVRICPGNYSSSVLCSVVRVVLPLQAHNSLKDQTFERTMIIRGGEKIDSHRNLNSCFLRFKIKLCFLFGRPININDISDEYLG